jgi:hypothetical protein
MYARSPLSVVLVVKPQLLSWVIARTPPPKEAQSLSHALTSE